MIGIGAIVQMDRYCRPEGANIQCASVRRIFDNRFSAWLNHCQQRVSEGNQSPFANGPNSAACSAENQAQTPEPVADCELHATFFARCRCPGHRRNRVGIVYMISEHSIQRGLLQQPCRVLEPDTGRYARRPGNIENDPPNHPPTNVLLVRRRPTAAYPEPSENGDGKINRDRAAKHERSPSRAPARCAGA
jgi:hypothetical protein